MEAMIDLYRDHPAFFIVAVGMLGLLIGSFLNVAAIRLPKGESVVFPPSHCMRCGHRLGWIDLIPLFSYIWLKGRCRYCHSAFSAAYLSGEALTGAVFALFAWQIGFRGELVVGLLLASVLITALFTDIRHRIIPDRLIVFGLSAAFALRLFIHDLPIWHYFAGFVVGGGVIYALAVWSLKVLKKEGIGGGDAKLLAFVGLVAGVKLVIVGLFLASLAGLLYGGFQMLAGKLSRGQYMAFGPFIGLGAIVSYLWGNHWVAWYFQIVSP